MTDSQDYKGTSDIAVLHANFVSAHAQMLEGKERIAELEVALTRQGDNMAFVLNHMDVKNWYDKFTTELAEDREALKPKP
jgi:hypothetical protein